MGDWGYSSTGRKKLEGFYGPIITPSGDISTEISTTVDFGEGEMEIPLLVPGLTREEIKSLLNKEKPSSKIIDKAVTHAKKRLSMGLNPFAQIDEKPIGLPEE